MDPLSVYMMKLVLSFLFVAIQYDKCFLFNKMFYEIIGYVIAHFWGGGLVAFNYLLFYYVFLFFLFSFLR